MTDSDNSVPEKYRPDPWIDVTCGRRASGRPTSTTAPVVTVRDWLGLTTGDTVGWAPAGPRRVKLGETVPRIIGEASVRRPNKRDEYTLSVPAAALHYTDFTIPGVIRFHRPEDLDAEYSTAVFEIVESDGRRIESDSRTPTTSD